MRGSRLIPIVRLRGHHFTLYYKETIVQSVRDLGKRFKRFYTQEPTEG